MKKRTTKYLKRKLLTKQCALKLSALALVFGICYESSATAINISHLSNPVDIANRRKEIVIRGLIKDENGGALPGAGIKLKGSSTVVSSDINGAFSITEPDQNAVLIISYVGYDVQEIPVGSQTTIQVQLRPTAGNDLQEVAVVAFGAQKKESLVGAQSTIKATELRQPVANSAPC